MAELSFRDYMDAWNSHDGSKVATFMADDVVYEDVPMGLRHDGKDAVAAFVGETVQMSNDYRFEVLSEIRSGGQFAAEWVMTGTNTGEGGGLPATGKPFSVRGSSVGEVNGDGRIAAIRDYWNMADYLMQIGILPPLGGATA